MNTQWNAEVVTPVEEGAGTKVLDNQSNVQPTLEAGSNIIIANGEISASGGGAEYTAGSGISIDDNNTISVDSDIRSGAAAGATAVQAADLATVATSGSYNDLSNKPSIPAAQVNSDWNAASGVSQILNKPTLATVATSGSYADLSNKPTIPTVAQSYNALSTDAMSGTAVAEAISGTGQVPSVTSTDNGKVLKATYEGGVGSFGWDAAPSGVPSTTSSDNGKVLGVTDTSGTLGWVAQTPAQVNSDWNAASGAAQILNKPTLATVATSGSYNDLSNKPSIPAAQIQSDWNQTNDQAVDFIKNKPTIPAAQVNADWTASSGVSQILNKPTLATVATSGSYNDLSNKPTIPTVDQTYNSASTNAQSGTAVAGALATINQVPASTSADEDKVLTVNSSGTPVWAAAQGGGGGGTSYTFSAPLHESSGTVVLDVDTDELNIAPKTTTLSTQREISAAESGYAWYLGNLTGDTSDTVYTFTFNNVQVSTSVQTAVYAQGKHIYPMLIGETYGSWGNQWIIPTTLSLIGDKISGSFSVCFKSGESDYPTHLDSYGNLSWASVLVFVVASDVPSAQVSSSNIYGASAVSNVSYSTGGSMLMVKHPVPAYAAGDAGKILAVNSGATGVEWINNVPIEVVSSMPASPTSGVLYIVTGA